jgi:hypothetical protein
LFRSLVNLWRARDEAEFLELAEFAMDRIGKLSGPRSKIKTAATRHEEGPDGKGRVEAGSEMLAAFGGDASTLVCNLYPLQMEDPGEYLDKRAKEAAPAGGSRGVCPDA